MEMWTEVRRRVLTGELSKHAACREYGINWRTLAKMLSHVEPPGYGVIPGRYKVFLTVEKTFAGCESLVPARYAAVATTPFEVTVDTRANKPFRFEIDPR